MSKSERAKVTTELSKMVARGFLDVIRKDGTDVDVRRGRPGDRTTV